MNFKKFIKTFTAPIDTEIGDLSNLPNFLIKQTIFMSSNAILQAIADVIIEILILLHLVTFKIPFRLEFLFLTMISTVIAYLTLSGIREGKMDVTRNTLIIGLLVESSLVIADLYLLSNIDKDFITILLVRLPFMLLTSANIYIIGNLLFQSAKTKKNRPNFRF